MMRTIYTIGFVLIFISMSQAQSGKESLQQKGDQVTVMGSSGPSVIYDKDDSASGESLRNNNDETISLMGQKKQNMLKKDDKGIFSLKIKNALPNVMYTVKDDEGNVYYVMNNIIVKSELVTKMEGTGTPSLTINQNEVKDDTPSSIVNEITDESQVIKTDDNQSIIKEKSKKDKKADKKAKKRAKKQNKKAETKKSNGNQDLEQSSTDFDEDFDVKVIEE